MITRLSHTTFYVLDYDLARQVYTEKLGFTLRGDYEMGGGMRWLTVSPPQQPDLELLLYKPLPLGLLNPEIARMIHRLLEQHAMGGGVFETDNCRKSYADLKAKGIEFLSAPREQLYGIEAIFRDGCGNWFSLTERSAKPASPPPSDQESDEEKKP